MRLPENKLRRIVKEEINRVLKEAHGSSVRGKDVEDFDKHDTANDAGLAINKAKVRLDALKRMADEIPDSEIQPLIDKLEQLEGEISRLTYDYNLEVR